MSVTEGIFAPLLPSVADSDAVPENDLLSHGFRVMYVPTKRKVGMVMDETLNNAIEEFVIERMNQAGMDAPAAVTDAITQMHICMKRLSEMMEDEQAELYRQVEDALALQIGEETRYYYKSGFYDAIHFLLGWRGRL